MSVIGRLDEQVNEILIAPVEKHRQKTKKVEEEISSSHEAEQVKDQTAIDRNEASRELPVWLL